MRSWARHFGVAVAFGLLFGAAGRAGAGPLDPNAFTSLGAFPGATGTYTLDTSGTPTLSGPGGTFTGAVSNGVAVFDFDAINVVSGQTINGTGPMPAALLSHDAITVSGMINFYGIVGPGPGGFPGGGGPGGGGAGGEAFSTPGPGQGATFLIGGGGGGFGGTGGVGGGIGSIPPSPPAFASGGPGGGTYGDLLFQLQGGSGGGAGGGPAPSNPGGGGGGAIELGAIGNISISGMILANGVGALPGQDGFGGGSGGGIFLHGDGVTLTGLLSARGGDGGPGGGFTTGGSTGVCVGPGGGGGGGRVVIDPGAGVFTATGGTIDVSGGSGGSGAGGGDLGQVFVVPEPMSLVMVGTGGLVLLGYGWRRRRRATA